MQLSNCELLPGVIVDTKDPMKIGRIKCVIPGYVDASFSNENMPWVRPLGMTRHQSFSKMMPGYKVWILVNKKNYNEFWYFPFFEFNDVAKEYLNDTYDDDQPEIFMAHNCGGNHAVSGYDENNGFTIHIGNNHINLYPDGKIEILGQQGVIRIDGSKIQIGNNGSDFSQQAVFGNKLKEILDNLGKAMNTLLGLSNGSCGCLKEGFQKAKDALEPTNSILSDNITIN